MTTKVYSAVSHEPAAQEIISVKQWWKALAKVVAGFIPLFAVLQFGPLFLLPRLSQPWPVVIPALAAVVLAVGFSMLFFRSGFLVAVLRLGYGRPRWRAIAVALVLSGLMLLFFPLLSLATGASLSLNADWLPVLVGIILFNGIAEETVFRGYVFGHMRRYSSFVRAAFVSLVLFAAVHLYLFVGNSFAIGLVATLAAVAAAFPMAYLFERGGNTIWAPVIVHVAVHSIRLVAIPEAVYTLAVMAWLVMATLLPLVVILFRKYLKE
jgi:membrane protease YdiL (CAAX protease family)